MDAFGRDGTEKMPEEKRVSVRNTMCLLGLDLQSEVVLTCGANVPINDENHSSEYPRPSTIAVIGRALAPKPCMRSHHSQAR